MLLHKQAYISLYTIADLVQVCLCACAGLQGYSVLNLLGKGGFAHVYRARCKTTGLEVAIKMVSIPGGGEVARSERGGDCVALTFRLTRS